MSSSTSILHPGERPHRACLNCRRKKVRCHGDQPTCRFCARLGQPCHYPELRPLPMSMLANDQDTLDSRLSALEERLGASATRADPPTYFTDPNLTSSGWPTSIGNGDLTLDFGEIAPSSVPPSLFPAPNPPSHLTLADQEIVVNNYFRFHHNQPYSFFHEETFRQQLQAGLLPETILSAVIAIAIRFSPKSDKSAEPWPSQYYADKAWTGAMTQCFNSEYGPNYQMVQAITLLALYDFTACRHRTAWIKIGLAATVAQALHMMAEPDPTLPWIIQEERRRTFWSIYLLDKMATCGRSRPPIFQDASCLLHLPGTESTFSFGNSAPAPTLQEFTSGTSLDVDSIGSFARTIVLAATLSRIASYAFQQHDTVDAKPPWDHNSDYAVLASKLHGFAAYFETWLPISDAIVAKCSAGGEIDYATSEPFIFSYVLYQLCHCLLQHPFLLRRQIQAFGTKFSTDFFASATKTGFEHAQELTHTLSFAKQTKHKAAASFFGYCSLVAGTINGLYQYSNDEAVRRQAWSALAGNVEFLKGHANYWPNAGKMTMTLKNYILKVGEYQSLIDGTRKSIQLDRQDIDYLYSIVDYGSMSTVQSAPRGGSDNLDMTTGYDCVYPGPQGLDVDLSTSNSDCPRLSAFESSGQFSSLAPHVSPYDLDLDGSAASFSQYTQDLYVPAFVGSG
ncbi:Fungal specific transcription factor domain-containing protein [Cladophialophora immunda]|nr:Fungal specific transcription factor domain-containing protein [Cladophialophora immunda]